MKNLIKLLENNKRPAKNDLPSVYYKIWDELSLEDGLLLRQDRIIIPPSLQNKVVKVAHEGHLGTVNTKRLLRSKYWFPKMNIIVDAEVKHCKSCQATVYQNFMEPLSMSNLPNGPWESVKIDFYGPLPSGIYLLTIADEYSRWVEVEVVNSTSAKAVIPK